MNKNCLYLSPRLILCLVLSLFLVGCSTDLSLSSLSPEHSIASGDKYRELARGASGNMALEYHLRAAESYLQANQMEEAGQVFREVQLKEATQNVDIRNKMLEARLALLKQDSPHALFLIRNMLATVTEGKKESSAFNSGSFNHAASLQQGKKIALLLPSKGPHAEAAKTIREGFFSAFYKSQKNFNTEPSIKVYDTNDGKAVLEAYRQALADNADMIVGPLTKSEVKTIHHMTTSVPILALNSIEGRNTNGVFQFGLMPEDEVHAVADHAKGQGHQKAVIIAPKNEWGKRMAKTFTKAWTAQGGQVMNTIFLNNNDIEDQSGQIQAALQIGQGKKARPREMDMVFLACSNELGRKLKPLIGFYSSPKLPVYATANIYTGSPMPGKDNDLDGVCFCDMPWVLNNAQASAPQNITPGATASTKNKTNAIASAPRYFALGMDAFQLAQHFSQTQRFPENALGATGNLSLEGHRIQRRLSCAKFINGIPQPE